MNNTENSHSIFFHDESIDFESLINTINEGIFILNINGYFEYVNKTVERFSGLSLEEFKKLRYTDMIPGEFHEIVTGKFNRNIRGEETVPFEIQYTNKEGECFPVEVSSKSIYQAGKIIGVLGVLRDISRRKVFEHQMRESAERFIMLTEQSLMGILILQDNKITYVNQAASEITGFSIEEIINSPEGYFLNVIHEDDRPMVIEQALKKQAAQTNGILLNYPYRVVTKTGDVKWVEMYSRSIQYDERPADFITIVDITKRKLAEDALRDSEERYRFLMENSMLGLLIFDLANGKFLYLNQRLCTMFDYTVEQGMQLSVSDLLMPDELADMYERVAAKIKGDVNLSTSHVYTVNKKNGVPLRVEISGTPVIYNNIPAFQCMVKDITETEKLQAQIAQMQKMEAIGTLAGGIAHDFNNILMCIQGNASLMLLDMNADNPYAERIANIEHYVQSGVELTKQLLRFENIGKAELKPTNLDRLIEKSSEMFGRAKKEIRIHHKKNPELWTVEVDQGQIEQVLLNLYVNAFQAMPGGGSLFLSAENITVGANHMSFDDLKKGRYVRISVTDTGIGMDDAVRQKIFDPFFTTKEKGIGTGLGLASAYGIIHNHGGKITVYSKKGEGASFNIYIPASHKQAPAESVAVSRIKTGTERILLIDDEPMVLDIGKKLLEKMGYTVVTAGGGHAAIEIYARDPRAFDMVIFDMIMPDMNGIETYRELKTINPSIRALLSSGYSHNVQMEEIIRLGCQDFIQKPFNVVDLSGKLRKILDKR